MIYYLCNLYRTKRWFKQLVDQTAHAAVALAVLWPAAKWGQFWLAAGLVGIGREIEQMRAEGEWNLLSARRWFDVAGWVIGGVILQVIV